MGLEKAIKSGKEFRKPYRGIKKDSASYKNRGEHERCMGNRVCNSKREERYDLKKNYREYLESENTEFQYGHNIKHYSDY